MRLFCQSLRSRGVVRGVYYVIGFGVAKIGVQYYECLLIRIILSNTCK